MSKISLLILLTIPILYLGLTNHYDSDNTGIQFQKIVIDSTFYSESAKAADLNRDGLLDIIAGDVWYEAPDWRMHEIREAGEYIGTLSQPDRPYGSGARYYCRSIGNYVKDINGDGWQDVITFNSQGSSCYWYENPKGIATRWEEHKLIEVSHNEAPQVVDLFSSGDEVPFSGHQVEDSLYYMCWFTPGIDRTQLWKANVIGDPHDFNYSRQSYGGGGMIYWAPGAWGHGLGIGDINSDGYMDVIAGEGWYEGTENGSGQENWQFHPVPFDTMADREHTNLVFAQMYANDLDGDGDNDVIAGSAHRYGLWWFEQVQDGSKIDFVKHDISMEYSQLHSMAAGDLNGDGIIDYVTGKRFLAHIGRDPGWDDPVSLIWIQPKPKDGKANFQIHVIDENSGAGTQLDIVDMNQDGKPDIITSNKKGTHLFLQL